ncbi:phage major capsid protein [Methylorubrum sp. SB2]|uniref:phage major capsid protein n=1 Tax=Methylorubrum subtropicum TaxID=3138812 RepID=UPI00313C8D5D
MLKFLRQQRADLTNEATAIFDKAAAEQRDLTKDEAERVDAIEAALQENQKSIERAEAHQERQRALGVTAPDANEQADRRTAAQPRTGNGFASLGEQMMAIARAGIAGGNVDPRLQATDGMRAGPTGMSEGIAADGGFLVQTDFVNDLLTTAFEEDELASRVRRISIGANSNGLRANGVDETSRANGSRWGGIQAYWIGEAGLKPDSKPRFKQINMELQKLVGLCYATDELLQDTTALQSWITQAFRDEFAFQIGDAIMNGSGAGKPLGFLNSGCTIVVPKETGQMAGTVVANNILKMWSRMPPRNRRNAVWLINQEVEIQLFQLMLLVKNVSGTDNVGGLAFPQVQYQPPGTNGNQYGTLMGRPVIPVEYAAALGTAGDVVLADLSQYLAIDKGPIQEASSIHVRFIYDETCFRFVYRFNGQPLWQKPLTPYRGINTTSPFVTLGTRS